MPTTTLDANVLVSGIIGYLRNNSTPGILFRRFETKMFHLVLSGHILDEVNRTLKRPDVARRLSVPEADDARRALNRQAKLISTTASVQGIATHAEDDLVLATAISGNADYLVTGDKGLLNVGSYRGVTIVTPRAFFDILDAAANLP